MSIKRRRQNGPHPTDVYVGNRLRKLRILKGVSQKDLAERLGISFQQIQKYERGSNRIGASRLWALGSALETPISYFFAGLEGKHDTRPANLEVDRETLELAASLHKANPAIARSVKELLKKLEEVLP